MPDKDGRLTPEELEKIQRWINEKGRNHKCPVCNSNSWAIGEHLLNGMVYYGGGLVVGGVSYPSFFLACQVCWFKREFMAVPVLGSLLSKKEEEKREEPVPTPLREKAGG